MSELNVYSTEYMKERELTGNSEGGMRAASYAFVIWLNVPEWFKEDEVMKDFVETTQNRFFSFRGQTDIELGPDFDFDSGIIELDEPNSFTIEHKDSLDMETFDLYVRWYKNQTLDDEAKLLYIMTRPDVDLEGARYIVEFAAGYDILRFKSIESKIDCIDMDDRTIVEFDATMTMGRDIEDFAQTILDEKFNGGRN